LWIYLQSWSPVLRTRTREWCESCRQKRTGVSGNEKGEFQEGSKMQTQYLISSVIWYAIYWENINQHLVKVSMKIWKCLLLFFKPFLLMIIYIYYSLIEHLTTNLSYILIISEFYIFAVYYTIFEIFLRQDFWMATFWGISIIISCSFIHILIIISTWLELTELVTCAVTTDVHWLWKLPVYLIQHHSRVASEW